MSAFRIGIASFLDCPCFVLRNVVFPYSMLVENVGPSVAIGVSVPRDMPVGNAVLVIDCRPRKVERKPISHGHRPVLPRSVTTVRPVPVTQQAQGICFTVADDGPDAVDPSVKVGDAVVEPDHRCLPCCPLLPFRFAGWVLSFAVRFNARCIVQKHTRLEAKMQVFVMWRW